MPPLDPNYDDLVLAASLAGGGDALDAGMVSLMKKLGIPPNIHGKKKAEVDKGTIGEASAQAVSTFGLLPSPHPLLKGTGLLDTPSPEQIVANTAELPELSLENRHRLMAFMSTVSTLAGQLIQMPATKEDEKQAIMTAINKKNPFLYYLLRYSIDRHNGNALEVARHLQALEQKIGFQKVDRLYDLLMRLPESLIYLGRISELLGVTVTVPAPAEVAKPVEVAKPAPPTPTVTADLDALRAVTRRRVRKPAKRDT